MLQANTGEKSPLEKQLLVGQNRPSRNRRSDSWPAPAHPGPARPVRVSVKQAVTGIVAPLPSPPSSARQFRLENCHNLHCSEIRNLLRPSSLASDCRQELQQPELHRQIRRPLLANALLLPPHSFSRGQLSSRHMLLSGHCENMCTRCSFLRGMA